MRAQNARSTVSEFTAGVSACRAPFSSGTLGGLVSIREGTEEQVTLKQDYSPPCALDLAEKKGRRKKQA